MKTGFLFEVPLLLTEAIPGQVSMKLHKIRDSLWVAMVTMIPSLGLERVMIREALVGCPRDPYCSVLQEQPAQMTQVIMKLNWAS